VGGGGGVIKAVGHCIGGPNQTYKTLDLSTELIR